SPFPLFSAERRLLLRAALRRLRDVAVGAGGLFTARRLLLRRRLWLPRLTAVIASALASGARRVCLRLLRLLLVLLTLLLRLLLLRLLRVLAALRRLRGRLRRRSFAGRAFLALAVHGEQERHHESEHRGKGQRDASGADVTLGRDLHAGILG